MAANEAAKQKEIDERISETLRAAVKNMLDFDFTKRFEVPILKVLKPVESKNLLSDAK